MISRYVRSAILLPLFAGVASARFASPAEGPVPFRRDRLPIEAGAIFALSRSVEELARLVPTETPEGRRGRAQMLALALALEPGSVAARGQLEQLANGASPGLPEGAQPEKSRDRLKRVLPWLKKPAAGPDAAVLARCLEDALVIAFPDDAEAKAARNGGESPAWRKWVPDLAAYQPEPAGRPGGTPPTADPPATAEVKLARATLQTPLWQRVETPEGDSWSLVSSPLEMRAKVVDSKAGGGDGPGVWIGSPVSWEKYRASAKRVSKTMETNHGKWPAGLRVVIQGPALDNALESKRVQSLSAVSLVLAEAAISGKAPTGVVTGVLDDAGKFGVPATLWRHLRAIEAAPAGRLVVPSAAVPVVGSFLALERPEFFIKNEVLAADDTAKLLDFSSTKPTAATVAVLEKFAEIRAHAAGQDLRGYIGNIHVRRRLEAIAQEAPWHVSARMLLLQSTGKRPTSLVTPVMAAELLDALTPMKWLVADGFQAWDTSYVSRLEPTYDACRTQLETLERYATRDDAALVQSAREVVAGIRTVAKAGRMRAEDWQVREELRRTRDVLVQAYKELTTRLRAKAVFGDNET